MEFKNKRILITAGPTWVPIDSVRVISNIATGETGILLAEKFVKLGAQVTLFLGPVESCCLSKKIRLVRFKFFDELRSRLNNELRAKIYDIIIHNAAVSDFKLKKIIKGKLASGRSYTLKLSPLPKVVKEIRAQNPKARLVIFKLEPGVLDKVLMQRAKSALRKFKADTVVANRVNPYRAFIIDSRNKIVTARNKTQLADRLLGVL